MIKIRPTYLSFCLAIFMTTSLSTQAHADQIQENATACRTAINAKMGLNTGVSSDLFYKLIKIQGNQTQRLTYRARMKDRKSKIICSVKRAKVIELTDGKKQPLK